MIDVDPIFPEGGVEVGSIITSEAGAVTNNNVSHLLNTSCDDKTYMNTCMSHSTHMCHRVRTHVHHTVCTCVPHHTNYMTHTYVTM